MNPSEARKKLMEKFGRWGEGELLYALILMYETEGLTDEDRQALKTLAVDYLKRNCNERLPEAMNLHDIGRRLEKCLDEDTKDLGQDIYAYFISGSNVVYLSPEEEQEILKEFEDELRELGVIK